MPTLTRIMITVRVDTTTPSGYSATVDHEPTVKRADFVEWNVTEPAGFPTNGKVFIQFVKKADKSVEDGPLFEGRHVRGKHVFKKKFKPNGSLDHHRLQEIPIAGDGHYWYEIWFKDGGNEYRLADPEIVVEGNSSGLVAFLRATLKLFQARSAPKRLAAPKRKAKKAKKR